MTDTILTQLLSIRDSGSINMCDWRGVQRVAFENQFYDLVMYIEDDPKRYFHFILYGEEPTTDASSPSTAPSPQKVGVEKDEHKGGTI